MDALARKRAVFHSEADFQHAFAWELHQSDPNLNIRLEVPLRTTAGSIHLDLLAWSRVGEIAIELKYKTRALNVELNGEQFSLMNHAAQDLGRYDFYKDLSRVEAFCKTARNRIGYCIFLTNDSAYWKAPTSLEHGYAGFATNDGRKVSGTLSWGDRASEGTRRGRQDDIALGESYHLKWSPYSTLPVKSYNEFQYLCVQTGAALIV